MGLSEFYGILKATGIPVAYREFEEGANPKLPFMVYYQDGERVFYADGVRYVAWIEVSVELYTDSKDPRTEEKVESALQAHGINFKKTENYWDEEHLYEVLYEATLGHPKVGPA